MTNAKIIDAMINAYDDVYEADNKPIAMHAAFTVAKKAIRERCTKITERYSIKPILVEIEGRLYMSYRDTQADKIAAAIRQEGQIP